MEIGSKGEGWEGSWRMIYEVWKIEMTQNFSQGKAHTMKKKLHQSSVKATSVSKSCNAISTTLCFYLAFTVQKHFKAFSYTLLCPFAKVLCGVIQTNPIVDPFSSQVTSPISRNPSGVPLSIISKLQRLVFTPLWVGVGYPKQ